jgi:hypothetical protein
LHDRRASERHEVHRRCTHDAIDVDVLGSGQVNE